MQGDINSQIGKKMAVLSGLDPVLDEMPQVRIVDPQGISSEVASFQFPFEYICSSHVSSFVSSFLSGSLSPFVKQKELQVLLYSLALPLSSFR